MVGILQREDNPQPPFNYIIEKQPVPLFRGSMKQNHTHLNKLLHSLWDMVAALCRDDVKISFFMGSQPKPHHHLAIGWTHTDGHLTLVTIALLDWLKQGMQNHVTVR